MDAELTSLLPAEADVADTSLDGGCPHDACMDVRAPAGAEPRIAGIEVTYIEIEEAELVRLGWW
jgi:hypothetical protein